MNHYLLLKNAMESIRDVFIDRSVSQDTTRESLQELKAQIEIYLDSIKEAA